MPSFADSIFLFVLALLLFGPKRLPVIARELGKWMGEFRRASNEFKMQMEDELRASEQADRQKQIAAMEAAAPIPPKLDEPAEPEHPHMRYAATTDETHDHVADQTVQPAVAFEAEPLPSHDAAPTTNSVDPLPIATSGSLKMMPPATGLPLPRSRGGYGSAAAREDTPQEIAGHNLPASELAPQEFDRQEKVAHGD